MSDVLALDRGSAGYGEAIVISDISLRLREGAALAVLGRNGTGKSTLLNTIVGVTRQRAGAIRLAGKDLTSCRPEERASSGPMTPYQHWYPGQGAPAGRR